MTWSIALDPVFSWPVLAVIGVIALIAASLGFTIRMPGAWLRLGAFLLLWLALLNPELRQEDRDSLPGVVAVVVDRSDSQAIGNRPETTEAARAVLAERLGGLRDLEVRWVDAGGGQVDGTEIFSTLEQALADVPNDQVAGVFVLSDGRVHDAPDSARALGFDAPVHMLITGAEREYDRRLVINTSPRFGIVGEEKPITFRVEDTILSPESFTPENRIEVEIRRDGELITTRRVTPGDNVTIPIEIARGGRNIIELEASEAPGELTTINNRAVITVEGIRENLRVLLVSGAPHAGERTWRNILKSDAAVDLVHFTILRPPEKQDGTPISQLSLIAFPTRELFQEKIDEFDLIIFDRYRRRGVLPISYFDNIARYVENGGALLVAAGPDFADQGSLARTPLAAVLPVAPTGRLIERPYHAILSETGERHPITAGLDGSASTPPDWSRWFRLVEANADRGQVLMTGPGNNPLLLVNRELEGRVALLLSDHAWLWARGYEGGGPYVSLLRRMAHWLMRETDLEEEALEASARRDRLVVERRTLADQAPPVTVTAPGGEVTELTLEEVEPGLFRATMPIDGLGLYTVADTELTTLASVGPLNPREFAEVTSTTEILAPVAASSGGGVFRIGDSADVAIPRILPIHGGSTLAGSDWAGLRPSRASVLTGISATPILAGLGGLLLLIGALGITWYREGR